MKMSILRIILLAFFITNSSFSQFYADSSASDYIVEFMKIANETTQNMYEYSNPKRIFTNEELEHIAKLYYRCYDENPVCFNDYVSEEHKKWEQRMRNNHYKSDDLRPWMKVYALRNQLRKKYGMSFTEVIGTSAFLRCKFIKLTFSKYHSVDLNSDFRVHNFVFVTEDVLKGNKFFSIKDTISILMIPDIECPAPNFIAENTYLIPVSTLLGLQDGAFSMIFRYLNNLDNVWRMGEPPKVFPIENETIKNCEYFGFQEMNWNEFKEYFKNTFLIFN
jgi:hypothetical protein